MTFGKLEIAFNRFKRPTNEFHFKFRLHTMCELSVLSAILSSNTFSGRRSKVPAGKITFPVLAHMCDKFPFFSIHSIPFSVEIPFGCEHNCNMNVKCSHSMCAQAHSAQQPNTIELRCTKFIYFWDYFVYLFDQDRVNTRVYVALFSLFI